MKQPQTERMEFASAEWLAFIKKLFIASATVKGNTPIGTTCEVYRNVPEHLSGSRTIAWTRRVTEHGTTVTFEECPDAEADVKLVGDYDALLPLARYIVHEGNEAEFTTLVEAAVVAQRIAIVRERPPAEPKRDYTVHNFIAALTR
jgi:hypothetical protein